MAGRGGFESRGGSNYGGKKPLPQEAPYLAFVGNLPQGVVQGDVIKIFDQQTVKGVRLVKDRDTDHFKGFCYVEFESLKDLEEALELDGRIQLEGFSSPLRIDVAEQKKDRGFQNKRGPIQRQNSGNSGGAGSQTGNSFNRGGTGGGRPQNDRYNDNYGGGRDFDRDRNQGGGGRSGAGGGGGGSFGNDRGPNRGRYGNFGEDGGSRGGFERNGREGSYGGQGRDDRGGNDRYGNYNRRGGGNNDRRPPPREFNDKPAGPVIDDSERPRLVLKPRTVAEPVNALAETKQAELIFGKAKPREEKVKPEE